MLYYALLAEKNLVKSTSESGTEWENESDGSGDEEFVGFDKVWSDSESCYSSDSSAQSSLPESPVPEDTNSKLCLFKVNTEFKKKNSCL